MIEGQGLCPPHSIQIFDHNGTHCGQHAYIGNDGISIAKIINGEHLWAKRTTKKWLKYGMWHLNYWSNCTQKRLVHSQSSAYQAVSYCLVASFERRTHNTWAVCERARDVQARERERVREEHIMKICVWHEFVSHKSHTKWFMLEQF